MLRVLQVYKDYYPPVKGGIEGHINLLACGLRERCIDVEVLVSNTRPSLERGLVEGIRVTKVPELGRLASAPINVTFPYWLKKLGRDADVLHFHFPNPTAELSYLISRLNGKVVVTYHSDIIRQARLRLLYTPFLTKFLESTQTIVATSPNYVRSSPVLTRFRKKCRIVPLGIDLSKFTIWPEDAPMVASIRRAYGSRIVLFIGRFRYYKGIHVLVEAMNWVKGKLLLIGAGPLETELRAQASASKAGQKIVFLGEVSDTEKVAYLRTCDLLVLPSILRSEAFGIVLLEAMACAKPVISTELGTGTSFVNQHLKTGIVVPPGDVQAMAHAINHLLAKPELREKYGTAGRERVEQCFAKDKMLDSIIKIYQEEEKEDTRNKPK